MSALVSADGPLISVAWLRENLTGDGLVILDARITRVPQPDGSNAYVSDAVPFAAGHIPGARFVALTSALSDTTSALNFTLPSRDALQSAFRGLGISESSTVVIYDDDRGQWAARVWLLLAHVGHERAGVLNGGLKTWIATVGALESGPAAPYAAGNLTADPGGGAFIDHAAVKALSGSDAAGRLVCALEEPVFSGARSSGAARPGHIPGSSSLPFSRLLDPAGHIDPSRVDPEMVAAGLDLNGPVYAYCGGGINAAGLVLALVAAGHSDVAVYDGSLQQWAADPDTAMALGEA